jgi:ACR3 family arsenite transporter
MKFFEKYLTVWVSLCIAAGIGLGKILGNSVSVLESWQIYTINIPVAVLVWMMIYPMMVQIDFSSIGGVSKNWKGLALTVTVNWLIKPFTMALFGWIFFKNLYATWITPEDADQYLAGAILLGAAPCTAMVFVWSYLVKGDANYTLIQVSVNDLILPVAFVPIVKWLLGVTNIQIPYEVLITSVVVFVVIPLTTGYLTNRILPQRKGKDWFEQKFLPALRPVSILALLSTLVLLFAFQGEHKPDVINGAIFHPARL